MICKSPSLANVNKTVTAERHLMVDMRLLMDGVQELYQLPTRQPLLSRFQYTVDPSIHSFSGYHQIKTMYKDEVFLTILVSFNIVIDNFNPSQNSSISFDGESNSKCKLPNS